MLDRDKLWKLRTMRAMSQTKLAVKAGDEPSDREPSRTGRVSGIASQDHEAAGGGAW